MGRGRYPSLRDTLVTWDGNDSRRPGILTLGSQRRQWDVTRRRVTRMESSAGITWFALHVSLHTFSGSRHVTRTLTIQSGLRSAQPRHWRNFAHVAGLQSLITAVQPDESGLQSNEPELQSDLAELQSHFSKLQPDVSQLQPHIPKL